MATATAPTREDFAKLLDEAFGGGNLQEGSVIKGKVVAVEKEFAVIDVGLKTEGRVALREFSGPGRDSEIKVGDEVEVFLDRIENALGEADVLADIIQRDKRDQNRATAPLKQAPDAHLLDTTHLDIDAAVRAAVAIVEAARAG